MGAQGERMRRAVSIGGVLGMLACQQDVPDVVIKRTATDPGPFAVQTAVVDIDLGVRSAGFPSVVKARVVAPEQAEEALPVVIFHHGLAVEVENYFRTASQLASWGYVVVMPQWDLAAGSRTHAALVNDAVAAMDWLQANSVGLPNISVETASFGMGGHARGGKQALLTAVADDRVAAVFNLDPVDAIPAGRDPDPDDYPSAAPELVGQLTIPMGHVGSGRGPEGPSACAPAREGYSAIFSASPVGTLQFVLPTAGHQDFTDPCADGTGGVECTICPAGDNPGDSLRFGRASLVAFFGLHLQADEGFAPWLEGDQPFELVPDAVRTIK